MFPPNTTTCSIMSPKTPALDALPIGSVIVLTAGDHVWPSGSVLIKCRHQGGSWQGVNYLGWERSTGLQALSPVLLEAGDTITL